MTRPVETEIRAGVEADIREQVLTRNAIARKHGVSGAFVTGISQDIGVAFDRSKTELAVAARTLDLAESRAELSRMLLAEARQAVEDLHSPIVITQWVSATEHQSGGWKSKTFVEPSSADKRNLMTIAGIAITKVAELGKTAQSEGSPEAASFVDGLAEGIDTVRRYMAEGGVLAPNMDPTADPAATSRDALLAEYSDEIGGQTAPETGA